MTDISVRLLVGEKRKENRNDNSRLKLALIKENEVWRLVEAECEHVTALKKRACEKIKQWNHTYNVVEKYCVDRREKKRIQKEEEEQEEKKERERSRSQEYK
jgi:hypothetical protein